VETSLNEVWIFLFLPFFFSESLDYHFYF
jgi:hypothetical protein